MGGHSMNAADLGLSGKFNLLKNFDAVVKIDFNKATDERRYWLTLHPTGHHDEFTECANPGLYQPPIQPLPRNGEAVPATVPDLSAAVPLSDLERAKQLYQGRDLEIATAIVNGWSKTKTREQVTGRAEDIGKRYDEIKAELYPSWDLSALFKAKGEQQS